MQVMPTRVVRFFEGLIREKRANGLDRPVERIETKQGATYVYADGSSISMHGDRTELDLMVDWTD